MSLSFRGISLRIFPAAVLLAVGISGLAAGTATAGTVAAPHGMKAAPHRVKPDQAPPPVDHQLCYNASSSQFTIPPGIRLINQFSPNGFVPVITPTVTVHCNPVEKTVSSGVYPITNPDAHLACYPISTSGQPTPTVVVTNQFGSATLQPSQPNLLCVPSWKSLTGPPGQSPPTPPNLNHFTCYPVTVTSGSYSPPPVLLQDEFASSPVSVSVSPVPQELCLPTEKILPSGQVFPIINPTLHLLCFPVSPTPIVPQVWDQNQFGTSPITIYSTKWLCPPSTKTVISS
jgi:hypothetical protein